MRRELLLGDDEVRGGEGRGGRRTSCDSSEMDLEKGPRDIVLGEDLEPMIGASSAWGG